MKVFVWQAAMLVGVLALTGCGKQEQNANEETKEVPMTAKPAENQGVGEQVVPDDAAQTDVTQGETNAENTEEGEEEIAEVIDFDEKEAATATADAEVEDESESK